MLDYVKQPLGRVQNNGVDARDARLQREELALKQELVSLLPRLRRFALALTASNDTAEDLLQSAVERALRNLGSFQQGRRLDSWMFKIMQNLWLDARRAAASAPPLVPDVGLESVAGEDGRDLVESRESLRQVREAFGALPSEQRIVMTLIVLEGMSYSAAAEALQTPIGTIMSRLSRARASIAAHTHRGAIRPTPMAKEN